MGAKGGILGTEAGATAEGKPFVVTLVDGAKFGQLTPSEAIAMGVRCIQSAIEAERDAGTVAFFREQGMGDREIAGFLHGMRAHRQQSEPNEAGVDLAQKMRDAIKEAEIGEDES